MGKIAVVFSGQGAQAPGMGLDLYENNAAAKRVFDAVEAIRPGTKEQCFYGSEDELMQTVNTQPCMFAMELAAAEALREAGVQADVAAGFSLGEISALAYSGAADIATGFQLVCRRGELMQAAAEKCSTAMAAVLKLTAQQVIDICSELEQLYPVNFNCPGQIVVSGLESSMPALNEAVRSQGGRVMPLKVKGAFHSPFMTSASEGFAQVLETAELREPGIPLYSNCTGDVYRRQMKELLARQIMSPVQWEKIVLGMIEAGVDTFIECGPGKTLCGLIAKTDKTVRTFSVQSAADLEKVRMEVLSC